MISKEHHEQRVKQCGLVVDEREHPESYRGFREKVTERLCRFWTDKKDIQAAIFQKLPEWAQRPDLVGWIRADEAPSTEVTNELARLSQENRDLRAKLSVQTGDFHGLTFEEMVSLLREDVIPDERLFICSDRHGPVVTAGPFRHAGELFEAFQKDLSANGIDIDAISKRIDCGNP